MSGRSLRRRMLGGNPLGRDIEKIAIAVHSIPLPGGSTDHGGLTGLGDDDHAQYMHISTNRTVTAQHSFSPASPQAPFLLGANAQGQLVSGLRADQLNKSVIAGAGLITGGVLTSDVTLDHDTGDFGDLHTNYAEHDQAETIVGPWGFTTNTVTITWPAKLRFGTAGLIDTPAGTIAIAINPSGDLILSPGSSEVKISSADLIFSVASSIKTSAGNLTLSPTDDLILDPGANDVFPGTTYTVNLGSVIKKYLTLHVAELWVSTLVAQNVVSTIGGRIIVAPSTELITAIDDTIVTIQVKHNNLGDATGQEGDIILMEAGGKLEFMVILVHDSPDSGKIWKTVTGPPAGYEYKVTRNHDATGPNSWDAGDAVVNTGQDGDGFIDLFSVQGVYGSDSGAGPTIVGNVRTGSAYNAFSEHWAIGNLNGLYGIGASDVYGIGLGRFDTGYNHMLITDANGIRFYEGESTVIAQWDGDSITLGEIAGGEYWTIDPTDGLRGFTGGLQRFSLETAGIMYLGYVAGHEYLVVGSSGIEMFSEDSENPGNAIQVFDLDASGNMTLGNVATDQGNMRWDNTTKRLLFRGGTDGTVVQAYIDTDGKIAAGGSPAEVWLDSDGLSLNWPTGGAIEQTATVQWDRGGTLQAFIGGFRYIIVADAEDMFRFRINSGATRGQAFQFYAASDLIAIIGDVPDALVPSTHGVDGIRIVKGGLRVASDYQNIGDGEIQVGTRLFVREDTNTNQTYGITLHGDTTEDEIFTLKTSSMTHGMTTITETDTYGLIRPWDNPLGGMTIAGLSDGAQVRGLSLLGYTQSQTTTQTTSTIGVVTLAAFDADGTGVQDLGTNAAILAIRNNATTRAIFVGNGRLFLNDTTLVDIPDDYDDGMLLHGLRASLQGHKTEFYKRNRTFVNYARPVLERLGIIEYNDGPGQNGRAMIDVQGLQFLTIDAVRQLYDRMNRYESVLLNMGVDPKSLEGGTS